MLSLQNKYLLITICCFLFQNILFCVENYVKKITSDIVEFDRKNNKTKFLYNVKVETREGFIICDSAEYDKINNKLLCESNVVFTYTASEKYKLEIRCSYLNYDIDQQIVEFCKNVYVIYKPSEQQNETVTTEMKNEINIQADNVIFNQLDKSIVCKNNVVLTTADNKIFCYVIKYDYEEGIININDMSDVKEQILFILNPQKYKIKTCKANNAVVDYNKQKIWLKGKVEVVF